MAVKNRLAELIEQKAKKDERPINASDVARAVGMTRQNISKWVNNNIKSYDGETISKLCRYFDCQVGDLIVRSDDLPDHQKEDHDPASAQRVE